MSHILSLLALTVAYSFPDAPMQPSPALVGQWRGTATVVNVVMLGTEAPVRLHVHGDGTVTGTVGDAVLRDGQFLRHRPADATPLQRKDFMQYMIRGHLQGPVLTDQRVTASEVFIPLDYSHGTLVGAVHLHGTLIAGKEFGIFSSDLTLRRSRD